MNLALIVILKIYIYYIICIITFITISKLYRRIRYRGIEGYRKSLSIAVNGDNKIIFHELIKRNLKDRDFGNVLINEYKINHRVKLLVDEIKLGRIIAHIKEKTSLDKSYKLKLIGEFKISSEIEYILNNIRDNDAYVQINAINALSRIGDEESFVEGVCEFIKWGVVNKEYIGQALKLFNGREELLIKKLKDKILNGGSYLIKPFLDYCILNNKDESEFIIAIIENENTLVKNKLYGLTYLQDIINHRVMEVFIKYSYDKNNEIRKKCCNGLLSFNCRRVYNRFLELLWDDNDEVARCASKGVYLFTNNKYNLKEIIRQGKSSVREEILSMISEEMNLVEYLCEMERA